MIEKIHLTGRKFQSHAHFGNGYFDRIKDGFVFRQKMISEAGRDMCCHTHDIRDKNSSVINDLVSDDDSALFICILGALGIVLKKYSGQEKVIINSHPYGAVQVTEQDIPLLVEADRGVLLKDYLNSLNKTVG